MCRVASHSQNELEDRKWWSIISGGFRNFERGVEPQAREACGLKIFGLPRPLPVTYATLEVRNSRPRQYLDKRLEISKKLMRECVTVPGCCCCMPLLYNHLMDLCKYVRKNTLLAPKWHPPYPP